MPQTEFTGHPLFSHAEMVATSVGGAAKELAVTAGEQFADEFQGVKSKGMSVGQGLANGRGIQSTQMLAYPMPSPMTPTAVGLSFCRTNIIPSAPDVSPLVPLLEPKFILNCSSNGTVRFTCSSYQIVETWLVVADVSW